MYKYKIFFTLDNTDNIHGIEFISCREVSDAYIYLLIRDTLKTEGDKAIDVKRKVCIPLNEVTITDIY